MGELHEKTPSTDPRPRWVGVGVGVALLAAALVYGLVALRQVTRGPTAEVVAATSSQEGGPLPVLWEVPAFDYVEAGGRPLRREDLLGQVWVADFIFTQCTSACPILSAKMVLLQRRLPDARLRFVSFSVDPEHDTPAALAAYRRRWNAAETRWLLLSTTEAGIKETAAGMRVALAPGQEVDNPIIHTVSFLLVDAEGRVRGAYDSNDDLALKRLARDAERLLAAMPPPATPATTRVSTASASRGEALYAALGCAGCHQNERVAPPLDRLSVAESAGRTAHVEAAIVRPGEHVTSGYMNIMPSYAGQLTSDELAALVAFVEARATGAVVEKAESPEPIRDPVCGMKVRSEGAPSFVYEGRTYYFCADRCRRRFAEEPGRYLEPVGDDDHETHDAPFEVR